MRGSVAGMVGRVEAIFIAPAEGMPVAESVLDCALRELREETGLEGVRPRVVAQASNLLDDERVWRSVFVAVDVPADREPRLCEPHRCATWGWFDPAHLPRPLFAPIAAVMQTA